MTIKEALQKAIYEIDEIITGERNLMEENKKNSYYCHLKEHIEELREVIEILKEVKEKNNLTQTHALRRIASISSALSVRVK